MRNELELDPLPFVEGLSAGRDKEDGVDLVLPLLLLLDAGMGFFLFLGVSSEISEGISDSASDASPPSNSSAAATVGVCGPPAQPCSSARG